MDSIRFYLQKVLQPFLFSQIFLQLSFRQYGLRAKPQTSGDPGPAGGVHPGRHALPHLAGPLLQRIPGRGRVRGWTFPSAFNKFTLLPPQLLRHLRLPDGPNPSQTAIEPGLAGSFLRPSRAPDRANLPVDTAGHPFDGAGASHPIRLPKLSHRSLLGLGFFH
jgi:hypothetical protein